MKGKHWVLIKIWVLAGFPHKVNAIYHSWNALTQHPPHTVKNKLSQSVFTKPSVISSSPWWSTSRYLIKNGKYFNLTISFFEKAPLIKWSKSLFVKAKGKIGEFSKISRNFIPQILNPIECFKKIKIGN